MEQMNADLKQRLRQQDADIAEFSMQLEDKDMVIHDLNDSFRQLKNNSVSSAEGGCKSPEQPINKRSNSAEGGWKFPEQPYKNFYNEGVVLKSPERPVSRQKDDDLVIEELVRREKQLLEQLAVQDEQTEQLHHQVITNKNIFSRYVI